MKNKVTAGLLAFFLGIFGVHRFYLGQVGKGIVYLLFCWTPIIWIISMIDFIVFLAMGEKSFNYKYNPEFIHQLYPAHAAGPTVVINQHGTHTYQQTAVPQPQPVYQPAPSAQSRREQEYQRRQAEQARRPQKKARPKVDPFQEEGDDKYREYDFDGAIRAYLRSLNVKSVNPKVHFRLACLYSLMEQTESSFFHLEKAVEQGFYNFEAITTHDHLAFLRSQQPVFDEFVANGYKVLSSQDPPEETLELSEDIISKLERLAKMKEVGLLTAEEFEQQKVKLLQ